MVWSPPAPAGVLAAEPAAGSQRLLDANGPARLVDEVAALLGLVVEA